ncbi:MAG: NAD-dependent epimerase/dehydratase family protein [Acidobacteria bacterium]|nr:NAD-dependent epimerase/dehydratase family protein [Acidobacteriota bacterium]
MGFWQNRNVFVTGASGLLGSWMVEELLKEGASVTCLLRDWVPGSKLISSGTASRANIVHGQLEDYDLLVRVINEYEIDSVFHLAAQTIVGTATRSAISTFDSNIRGTWNLLEACRICPTLIERIVFASSDKAYGAHDNLPYTEDMALQGRFPYDVSKSCADLIAQSYFHSYGMPITITRCVNLFGGGDLSFNRLVPGTIASALRNERPVIRSNGKFVRDYFYVLNVVEGYMKLAEKMPDDSINGQAFNFGYGEPLTVVELVDEILTIMDKRSLEPIVLNEASNEIVNQYLDCSKAQKLLGWRPRFDRQDGLKHTINWYRDYFDIHEEAEKAEAVS